MAASDNVLTKVHDLLLYLLPQLAKLPRDGNWNPAAGGTNNCRVANRNSNTPDNTNNNI